MTDYPANPVPHRQIHPGLQFLIVIGLLLVSLFVGTFIGIVIVAARYGMDTITAVFQSNLDVPHATSALWIIQFFGTTAPILATPLIFSYLIVKEPDDYLKNNFHFPWLLIIIAFVIMTFANPLLEFLGDINQKMVLPKFLRGVEEWMRKSEDDTKKLSDMMMEMGTFKDMVFNLLFIGLLTAIVEEILFRGCLQTIFVRWMKNKHVAIWVVAILFSAFHMEFFGFLPRLLLGALFGYFTAWSGSVWPAIWGHFVNNGTIVVLTYLNQHKISDLGADNQQVFNYTWYIISFVITVLLLLLYRYTSNRWQLAHTDGEELD